MGAHFPTSSAQSMLGEAFDLLSILGIYPNFRMFWVQPDDWLMSSGMTSGCQYSSEERFGPEVGVPAKKAEALGAAYFSLDLKREARCCAYRSIDWEGLDARGILRIERLT
jgi:hypothetical protein